MSGTDAGTTTASGALMVPSGLGAVCTGARPIVLYAHGTTTDRAFNMGNMQNAETLAWATGSARRASLVCRRTDRRFLPMLWPRELRRLFQKITIGQLQAHGDVI
jgi:hypothetical protein